MAKTTNVAKYPNILDKIILIGIIPSMFGFIEEATMLDVLKKYNYWNSQTIETGFFRSHYTSIIEPFLHNRLIKVLLGQRRAGKSFILKMLMKHLIQKEGVKPTQILYINMDLYDFNVVRNHSDLMNLITLYRREVNDSERSFLFLDEIQEISNWEKVVNSLSQDHTHNFELFISGSNANLLSSELSTYLSGRYVTIPVYPFSYTEFCGINSLQKGSDSFLSYLKNGGLPEIAILNDNLASNYISALKDSIILRDIVQRHHIRDVDLLRRLFDFLIDSVGSLFSTNSIVKYLKSSGYNTNTETINSYLSFIVETLSVHQVSRFDIRGKAILSGERKFYLNDTGFKYFTTSSFDFGIGKYLENAVFLSLKRQGYDVYVGKLHNAEIDFIAEKNGEKQYIQVAYLLSDEKVIEREFGNFKQVRDNFTKLVVSMDIASLGNREGIKHVCAWDFVE